jgi:hypothetical protein
LTLPLLGLVLIVRWRSLSPRVISTACAAFAAGLILWAVPMVLATGGLENYMAALGGQGAEDFTGVDMLYRNPTPARLAAGLMHTFVSPWGWAPLATAILSLATVGALRLAIKAPRALLVVIVAFAPYAAFHLLFHESITTRYALPLVPAIAWMASLGLSLAGGAASMVAAGVLVVVGVAVTWPAAAEYREHGAPVSRAVRDIAMEAAASRTRPAVGMHFEMRRAVEWSFGDGQLRPIVLGGRPGDEAATATRYFEEGGRGPVWFLANPRRVDLAVFDPASVREVRRYAWPFDPSAIAGNTRPNEVAWYELSRPGWYVSHGWALNPEMAGWSSKLGLGPSVGPIEAKIRRRPGASVAMIGGRHLGPAETGPARVAVTLDGRPLVEIETRPEARFFLRQIELRPGALVGEGAYAHLSVSASGGGPVAIEQFDLQDADRPVFGFAEGWHEPEYAPHRGLQWRWASETAALRVHDGGRDLDVEIRGESPLRYFDAPSRIVLSAGSSTFQQIEPRDDFVIRAVVPHSSVRLSGGLLTLSSSQHFTPAERGESADPRHLALRIYGVSIRAR